MKQLLCLMVVIPLIGKSQAVHSSTSPTAWVSKTTGIQWLEGLSWEKVKEKAQKENKYIFLDFFATWCEPCKMMDKYVYVNDSVGDVFNQHFLSVRVQMDKTKEDNDQVRRWHEDAVTVGRQYQIEAYPTFVFLSPQGILVEKGTGYKDIRGFITLAQTATKPGKVYNQTDQAYDRIISDYKQGIKHYDSMLYVIKIALKFDTALAQQLLTSYTNYISTINSKRRYTKENIEFWSLYILGSKTKAFSFFYKDGAKIDEVMNQKGFAASIVDRTIMEEIVTPFLIEQNKNSSIAVTGMYMGGKELKADYSEADWKKLEKTIREKFGRVVAKRDVLAAKIEWYNRHRNAVASVRNSLIQYKKYPPPTTRKASYINHVGWSAFLNITEVNVLNEVIICMEKEVQTSTRSSLLDTYANLLYKVGRKEEAIRWEEKAISAESEPSADRFRKVLEKMKRREPTYGVVPIL
jgi:thioredoxin-related protein